MIKATLLQLNSPTINSGRIYPTSVISKSIAEFKDTDIPIFDGPNLSPEEKNIVGLANNIRIEGEYLVADVEFYKERMDLVCKPKEIITIRPNAIGSMDPETKIVHDNYKILGLCIRHEK